jgi:hypothetical protein
VIGEVTFDELVVEGGTISLDHLFEHSGRGHPWQIRPPCCRGERQPKPNQIVGRVTYNRLVEITYLDSNLAVRVRDRPQITNVAITADPDRRTSGRRTAFGSL